MGKEFVPMVEEAESRVKREPGREDGNRAVYYKLAGEFYAWAGFYEKGKTILTRALGLLKEEKSVDCTRLIKEVDEMLAYCNRCLTGKQESPMTLPVAKDAKKTEP